MATFRSGDRVRFATLPGWVARLPEESRAVFAACLGKVFPVSEVTPDGLLVLDVSAAVDSQQGGFQNDIRVEPEFVEPE